MRYFLSAFLSIILYIYPLYAQDRGLQIEITEGVIETIPIAIAPFIADNDISIDLANKINELVKQDLVNSGFFRVIAENAYIAKIETFEQAINFGNWRAINAQGLAVGDVNVNTVGRVRVRFRFFDVFANTSLGRGLQFDGAQESWRSIAHRIADEIYKRIIGEDGYFDSRIVFVDERGPKNNRTRRLAIMDYDGENVRYLTDGKNLVLAPRIAINDGQVFYTGYQSGFPRMYMLDINRGTEKQLVENIENMAFAPRPSSDGTKLVYSIENRGNTDIYIMNVKQGTPKRLTTSPAIDTAPSFSPDGKNIVFESDRSGSSQLYVMPVRGGRAKRISFKKGIYGAPVWSPKNDFIAFTKQYKGRFHIGVMRTDGTEERLLTASFLDESPSWAPNGRIIIFSRLKPGDAGRVSLYAVDISGRNLRKLKTPHDASDPAWSGLIDSN